jgi:hypothetical protein
MMPGTDGVVAENRPVKREENRAEYVVKAEIVFRDKAFD